MRKQVKETVGTDISKYIDYLGETDKRQQKKGWYVKTHSGKLVRLKRVAEKFCAIDLRDCHTTNDLVPWFKFLERFDIEIIEIK